MIIYYVSRSYHVLIFNLSELKFDLIYTRRHVLIVQGRILLLQTPFEKKQHANLECWDTFSFISVISESMPYKNSSMKLISSSFLNFNR